MMEKSWDENRDSTTMRIFWDDTLRGSEKNGGSKSPRVSIPKWSTSMIWGTVPPNLRKPPDVNPHTAWLRQTDERVSSWSWPNLRRLNQQNLIFKQHTGAGDMWSLNDWESKTTRNSRQTWICHQKHHANPDLKKLAAAHHKILQIIQVSRCRKF